MSSKISLILLLLWATECTPLTLTSSTTLISRNGTQDFYLNCSTDDRPENQSQSEMVEIRSMRISKLESSRWRPVIEMDSDWKTPTVDGSLKSSFLIGEKGPTSLQVTWDLATDATAGQYVCDVIGFMWNGQGAWQRTSTLYVDIEIPPTQYELMEMIQSSSEKLDTALKSINIHNKKINHIIRFNVTKLHNTVEEHDENFETMKNDIKVIQETIIQNRLDSLRLSEEHERNFATIRTDIEIMKEKFKQTKKSFEVCKLFYDPNWPQGTYALLMPESGCPADDGVVWKTGWRKHHTESGRSNLDKVSKRAHMKKPIVERSKSSRDNFMTQHHCSVIEPSTGREWPAGSYCVMKYRKLECPIGFMSNFILWNDEDTNNKNAFSGYHAASYLSEVSASGNTEIYYCCRNDSSPFSPVQLPITKPFYLFRFQGRCQQVQGMKVKREFMFFDTENNSINIRDYIPDGSRYIGNVRLQLCYYEQR